MIQILVGLGAKDVKRKGAVPRQVVAWQLWFVSLRSLLVSFGSLVGLILPAALTFPAGVA